MTKATFTIHYCPHCDRTLPDAAFSTFRDHVLDRHRDNETLVTVVKKSTGWSPPSTIHGDDA